MRRTILSLTVCLLLAGAGADTRSQARAGGPAKPQFPKIDQSALMEHIKVLSSDAYEGRAPGTKGEELTVRYLVEQSKRIGLRPGNPDGTYVQKVPLVGITGAEAQPFTVSKDGQPRTFKWSTDVVAFTQRMAETTSIADSEMVFVGYGVTAPEYNWDDFKGLDVKGKTLVVLVNDPQVSDASDAAKLDPKLFNGQAMTYYGRWTYKYEKAAELGAAGVFIVHETGPAGYPYPVVQGFLGERFNLVAEDKNMRRAAIQGWFSLETAREILRMAGQDLDALKKAAVTREFKPVPLGLTASMALRNTMRRVDSQNVAAKVDGSDPRLKDEYVVFSSHWDHLGVGEPVKGDRIYNGALDNASGVATLLEIGRAFTQASAKPKRSLLFLFVTAEEQGLLGSEYYATNPLYPLQKTAANINVDGANQWGRTSDVTVIGMGASDLDDYLREAAAAQNRTLVPDPESEKGFYYRSDHFNFAKVGVPALYTDSGITFIGRDASYSKTKRDEYTANDYHKPSDEIKPDWDLAGAVEDAQLMYVVAYNVANAERLPEWKPGNEFKAKRDAMMKR